MAVEAEAARSLWNIQNDSFSTFLKSSEPFKVHNHLLDTQIYAALGENEVLQTRPAAVNFQGFTVGNSYVQKLRILNMSSQCQRMHIMPPALEEFKIFYEKVHSLVPGMYLEVEIRFTPIQNDPYHDCIRIHSERSSNLIVPIHAYLHVDIASSFPSRIQFKATVVGQSSSKQFQLQNPTAADFDFQISFLQQHPSYTIQPMAGVIPANKFINITVTYSPTQYCTACAELQIAVSQFNSQPHLCSLTGSCEPGLATKIIHKELQKIPEITAAVVDPRALSPLGRSRAKKNVGSSTKEVSKQEPDKGIFKDGIHFPSNLNTPAAVGYVLTQKAGTMKARDVREAIKQQDSDLSCSSKQMKEAVFQRLVHQNISEEERNQLRWCIKLGDPNMIEETERKVISDRQKALSEFKVKRGDPDYSEEFNRSETHKNDHRIPRLANQHTDVTPSFDLYLNDEWEKRHRILKRFIEAVRKVIVRQRATTNLKFFQNHLESWRMGNFMSADFTKPKTDKERMIVENFSTTFDASKLKPFAFPEYQDSVNKDDMAVDALGVLFVPPITVHVRSNVQTYKLKVPQQYKLLSYNKHNFTSSVCKYITKKLSKELRTGAKSEITQIEYQSKNIELLPSTTTALSKKQKTTPLSKAVRLAIPSQFLQPKNFHPMHVFNPLPGVQAHAQPLPYSETDADYNLSPFSHKTNHRLNKHGMIEGVMSWKKFPCQGAIEMNGPSLSNVYVPRRSDPFGEELIPTEPPPLLTCLPDDDVIDENEDSDSNEPRIVPTLEMIQNEFKTTQILQEGVEGSCESSVLLEEGSTFPSTNNPQCKIGAVDQELILKSFEQYLRRKQNSLGEQIKSHVKSIQSEWDLR